jgi:hypothetical protein
LRTSSAAALLLNLILGFNFFYRNPPKFLSIFALELAVLLVGLYGSYTNKFAFLTLFAVTLLVLTIFGFIPRALPSFEFNIFTSLVALIQSLLLTRAT